MKCHHFDSVELKDTQSEAYAKGCEDCLKIGGQWVHLRECLVCGHVGCCDSSPRRHASGHFQVTAHPVMGSAEAGETWRWCFVDQMLG